jgi:hypothetical protein
VKVLNVFGLQPKIRPDLEAWSPDLFTTFSYLCNRSTSNTKDKKKAFKMLDLLFDKTEHNSYFGKMNFGSKEKFKTATNSSLYLLILTWLRQLEQYFYNFDGNDDFDGEWNDHGKYYATTSMMKPAPLANIHMAKEDEILTNITDVSFFEPTHRDGVCVSLEEWGAKIFEPHDKQVLRDAKRGCEKTNERFNRANNVTEEFSFTKTDLSSSKDNDDEEQQREDAAMPYDISPDRHKDQKKEMLLYNISRGIQLLLNKSEPKINKKKKKMKKGEEDGNVIATTAASSLLALVNGLDNKSKKFNQLDDMQNHMSDLINAENEKKTGTNHNKQDSEKMKTDSDEDSSSSSEYKKKTPQKGLRKQMFDSSSSDSDSD